MNYSPKKLTILLVCNNFTRDFPGLKVLKSELKKKIRARVIIVGSIAEVQRTYYLIYKYKPHIVVLYQVQEQCSRDIARYVRNSGGMIAVVPTEVTVAQSSLVFVVDKNISCNDLVDYYFFPGKRMYGYFLQYSDIEKRKLYVTGSPKIDASSCKLSNVRLARARFCQENKIPQGRKNIFLFTSFVTVPEKYIRKDIAFSGGREELLSYFQYILRTKRHYLKDIAKLCRDFPENNIVIKVHPLEDLRDYKKIIEPNLFIVKENNIYQCLPAIDLALHWNSTASTECWIHSKKTIQYNPLELDETFLSDFTPGNPLCLSYNSLKSAVNKYLHSDLELKYLKFQKNYLKDTFGKLDGQSGERIAEIIKKKVSRALPKVNYQRHYSPLLWGFFVSEKILGLGLTNRIIKLLRSDYEAEYASSNRINEHSQRF